jgi:hypothetical protein
MYRKLSRWAMTLIPAFTMLFLLSGCFAAYATPDKETIQKALFGGEWPGGLPVPAFIAKLQFRGSMSFAPQDTSSASFYFENVKKDEVDAYIGALKGRGFNVNGLSYTYSSGSGNGRLIDAYEAKKDRFTLNVSAFGRRPDGYIVIAINGLTADELKTLNCPSVAEEEAKLAAGQRLQKRYTEDISQVLLGSPQEAISDGSGKWIEGVPAPAFIQNLDVEQEKPKSYDSEDSVRLRFRDVTAAGLENYLVALAQNGFRVYNTASYQGFEGIDPHGALEVFQLESGYTPARRSAQFWPGGFISAVKDSLTIDITEMGQGSISSNTFAALLTKAEYQSKMEGYGMSGASGIIPERFDVSFILRGIAQLEKEKLIGSTP